MWRTKRYLDFPLSDKTARFHPQIPWQKKSNCCPKCIFLPWARHLIELNHNMVIEDLHDMKCPSWLLKIIASFLTERKVILKFNNVEASPKTLPGGGPQGSLSGGLIFLIKFNEAMLPPPIPNTLSLSGCAVTVNLIDDVTAAASVNLLKNLQLDNGQRPRPTSLYG